MNLRHALVVGTHPEDHSLDLVMLDDGSRVVGAQLLSSNASARTGTFDMPHVPPRKKKWDATERTDQDQIAMVGYFGRHPVVMGFLYPQVNQITRKSDKSMTYRHQSDVMVQVGEKGAISISHPGGLSISIGTPTATGLESDGSNDEAAVSRNKGVFPDLRIIIRGSQSGNNAFDLYVSKDGDVSMRSRKGLSMYFEEDITIEGKKKLTLKSGGAMSLQSGAGLSVTATGAVGVAAGTSISQSAPSGIGFSTPRGSFSGSLSASGDVAGGGVSLGGHTHGGVEKGTDTTSSPTAGGGGGATSPPASTTTTGSTDALYGTGLPGDTNPDTRPIVVSGPSSDEIIHYGGPGQPGYDPTPAS